MKTRPWQAKAARQRPSLRRLPWEPETTASGFRAPLKELVDPCKNYGRVDSNKLEHGCGVIYDGVPSVFGMDLEDGHVPTL